MLKTNKMRNLDTNYLNKFKSSDINTFVILEGLYQSELSDGCDDLVFDKQTLNIPKNSKLEKPIHLLFITSQDCDQTINIIAEENSSFAMIEEHTSLENHKHTNNIKIKITAKKNSSITYYKLQNENNNATHNAKTNIRQEQNSKVISGFIGKGAKSAQDNLKIELAEENASYNAIGIISLNNNQRLNHKTRIEHLAPNCTSNILFKGIIDDKATGTFDCLVVAHSDAIKTETHVTNKNLLLSDSATMNSSPELEIYTDDVICTHGATVGQLDQEALFYLRSHGLSENTATSLLTSAFVQEIVDQFAEYCKKKITLGVNYEH
jgi:Fe-S cluster assembly protein SufD